MEEKRTSILFVCVENSCRSQMAEGFARKLGGERIGSFSAGSKPSGRVNPDAVSVMKEAGIDISGQRSKGFTDLSVREFDHVVTMGCQDVCPIFPAKKKLDWQIEDPKGKGIEKFREARDIIKMNVAELLTSI